MNTASVITEAITLKNKAPAVSVCVTRYCSASMTTIGITGIAVVSAASLTKAIPQGMACTLEIGDYLRQRLGQG